MKLHHIALASLAVMAGQAHALPPTAFAAATKVYFSGASATKAAFGGLFTQNCQASTRNDYTLTGNSGYGTVYSCTLNTANDFGVGAINVFFQKKDDGGSAIGVFPVSNNTPTAFIDMGTCTTPAGTAAGTCTGLTPVSGPNSIIPDGGTSDLNLDVFNAALNKPAGVTASVGTNWVDPAGVGAYVQTSFGLGVSQGLYAALQADQGTTGVPTVNPEAVAQIIGQGYIPPATGNWAPLLSAAAPGVNNSITICRRVNGSGTQAAANAYFLQYPFHTSGRGPSAAGDSGPGYTVSESAESGGVRTCLTSAGAAFAIGHLSNESDDSASTWKFVKIGNQTSGTATARLGQYNYIYDSFCGINGSKPTGTARTIATQVCTSSATLTNLNQLSTAQKRGVMGSPASAGCTADPANALCSQVWRTNGDAKNPVVVY